MFSLGKIIFGMVLMIAIQLVYFEKSSKVMIFAHNLYSETKVVYAAAKEVMEKRDTIEKMGNLVSELKDSTVSINKTK